MDRQAQAQLINQDLASVEPKISGTIFHHNLHGQPKLIEDFHVQGRKSPVTPAYKQTMYLGTTLPSKQNERNSASQKCQIEIDNVYAPNDSVTV